MMTKLSFLLIAVLVAFATTIADAQQQSPSSLLGEVRIEHSTNRLLIQPVNRAVGSKFSLASATVQPLQPFLPVCLDAVQDAGTLNSLCRLAGFIDNRIEDPRKFAASSTDATALTTASSTVTKLWLPPFALDLTQATFETKATATAACSSHLALNCTKGHSDSASQQQQLLVSIDTFSRLLRVRTQASDPWSVVCVPSSSPASSDGSNKNETATALCNMLGIDPASDATTMAVLSATPRLIDKLACQPNSTSLEQCSMTFAGGASGEVRSSCTGAGSFSGALSISCDPSRLVSGAYYFRLGQQLPAIIDSNEPLALVNVRPVNLRSGDSGHNRFGFVSSDGVNYATATGLCRMLFGFYRARSWASVSAPDTTSKTYVTAVACTPDSNLGDSFATHCSYSTETGGGGGGAAGNSNNNNLALSCTSDGVTAGDFSFRLPTPTSTSGLLELRPLSPSAASSSSSFGAICFDSNSTTSDNNTARFLCSRVLGLAESNAMLTSLPLPSSSSATIYMSRLECSADAKDLNNGCAFVSHLGNSNNDNSPVPPSCQRVVGLRCDPLPRSGGWTFTRDPTTDQLLVRQWMSFGNFGVVASLSQNAANLICREVFGIPGEARTRIVDAGTQQQQQQQRQVSIHKVDCPAGAFDFAQCNVDVQGTPPRIKSSQLSIALDCGLGMADFSAARQSSEQLLKSLAVIVAVTLVLLVFLLLTVLAFSRVAGTRYRRRVLRHGTADDHDPFLITTATASSSTATATTLGNLAIALAFLHQGSRRRAASSSLSSRAPVAVPVANAADATPPVGQLVVPLISPSGGARRQDECDDENEIMMQQPPAAPPVGYLSPRRDHDQDEANNVATNAVATNPLAVTATPSHHDVADL